MMILPRPFILTLLVVSLGIAGCATAPPAPLPPGMTHAIEETWESARATGDDGRWDRALDQAYLAEQRHDTTASGYGTATGSAKGYAKEQVQNAFDGKPAKYCIPEENFWVQYRYGGGVKHRVTSYAIQSANDIPGRDPKNWTLQGSNDGNQWDILDQQSDISFPERHFTRVFDVANPGAYNLYRLDVQQNLGDSNSQIAELDLLAENGQETPAMDAELKQLLANREQGLAPLFAPDFSDAIVNPGSWVFEEDGVLVPKGGGEIWSKDVYGDFLIDLEFKCVADTNSGVLLRCANIKRWVQTTIEVQILQPENPNKKHECAGIFDCLEPRRRALKPVGEWNHYTIIAKGPDIHVILNGEYVTHLNVDLWTTANQNPDGTRNKFSTAYRDMARDGHLGLQYHGQQVWFRNVRVKRLD